MTPKEKAFELITKFQHPISEKSDTDCLHIEVAKEFALIAVDEVMSYMTPQTDSKEAFDYWREVKQEIENL
jgi:hypothetical protein